MAKKTEAKPETTQPSVEERIIAAIDAQTRATAMLGATLEALYTALIAKEKPAATVAQPAPTPEPKPAPAVEAQPAPTPEPAAEKMTKPNGKAMSPEDLEAEMKKLIIELAQNAGRDAVVKILTAFGVGRASEVPVAKLPEFVTTLRAAVAKAS